MYANRRSARHGLDARSATIALAINGAVLGALIFAAPEIVNIHRDRPLVIDNIPLAPPPEPLPPPKPVEHTTAASPQTPMAPIPLIQLNHPVDIVTVDPPVTLLQPVDGLGTGTVGATPTPTPVPALVGPEVDERYVHDLQPDYPAEETRAAREGRVVVRVLIGVDGRVRQVERTSATSDAFWRATQRQALAHWRFRPATRGGVPEEAWRTMAIRFVLRE